MHKLPTARECMTQWFATLRPEMDVFEAIDILESKRAAGAPVVDDRGNLLGILTEKDCLRVLSNGAYSGLQGGMVAKYMSEPKAVLTCDMDLFTIADKFLSTNFAVLPVVENGRPVGRISRQDMLRAIQRMQRAIALEKQKGDQELQVQTNPRSIDDFLRLAAANAPQNFAPLMSDRLHE